MKIILAAFALFAAAPATAQDMSLTSQVLVERTVTGPDGRVTTKLEEPKTVVPGDRVVIELRYANAGAKPAADFVVTNPVPAAIAFHGAASPGNELSVDGGKTWGALGDLKVANADGTARAALPADVTHVRWALKAPVPAKGGGTLTFGGVIR